MGTTDKHDPHDMTDNSKDSSIPVILQQLFSCIFQGVYRFSIILPNEAKFYNINNFDWPLSIDIIEKTVGPNLKQ